MQRAFSLVELSIVLVILGLLTGGILAGQSLIRAAELRAVSTESSRYLTAVHTFRDKYFAIPGDMTNATSFWGKDATYCNGHTGVANVATGTCNGNGDGIWNVSASGNVTDERFQLIRQLALAGLVEGQYSGITGPLSQNHCVTGTNCPASKLSPGTWAANYAVATALPSPLLFVMDYGNHFILGKPAPPWGPIDAIISPEEAWNIDTKMDDGRPASGRVIGNNFNTCAAPDSGASVNTNLNASYRLNVTGPQCLLYLRVL